MSETFRPDPTGETQAQFRDMAAELERTMREDIMPLAGLMEDAFETASRSISDELAKAARSGELSFRSMVQAVLADLARLGAETLIRQPLETVLSSALSGTFGGARAAGGAVAPGSAYLVGERGPELFLPPGTGRIAPLAQGGGGVTVNLHLGGVQDRESFRRSEPQIAAALQRTLSRASRNG